MMKLPLNVDFTGKVVVVTGAGGVLCGEMARAYAQAGAKVAALDLNEEAVKKLADELTAEGFICKGYKANVLDAEALEAVHQQVLADLGPCDILINGAGGNNPRATTDNEYQHEAKEGQKTFFDLEPNGVDFVFKLNFQGTLLPTQAFAKDMVARMEEHVQDGHDYAGKCSLSMSACREDAEAVRDMVEAKFPALAGKVQINDIGTVIGSHTGPGTVALFFMGDERGK